jgi:lysophospholipase L1-like esterase
LIILAAQGFAAPTNKETFVPIRLLALGDSYTIGEGVRERERWPNKLAALLRGQGYSVEVTVVAQTGWTTQDLAEGLRVANLQGVYDFVTLLIGVNNQYRGLDLGQYRGEFRALLGKAIKFAGGNLGRVIVLSIPDWSAAPHAAGMDTAKISAEIDAFNAVNLAESDKMGVRYIDITAISRRVSTDPSLLAADGLHPSAVMVAAWADLIFPAVMLFLGQSA